MIPRKIHYCWFGGKPLDTLSINCIESWKTHLPNYELRFWNENTFNINHAPVFVQQAYALKKFAFVSDYVRAWALYNEGGIYLDTDVEIKKNLDVFLQHNAFSGFESKGYPFTALWGTEAKHSWPKLVMEYYEQQKAFNNTINTSIVADLLQHKFGANKYHDATQYLKEGIVIYPSNYFCVNLPDNFACHHFNGSWMKDKDGNKIAEFSTINTYNFYANKAIELRGEKELIKQISIITILLEIPKRIIRPLIRIKNK